MKIATLVALSLVAGGAAAQPRVLTLDEALDKAFASAPGLAAAAGRATAAAERAEVAFGGYLPTLRFDAAYARQTGNYAPQPGQTPDVGTTTYGGETFNYFSFALVLNQPIYDFGRTGWAWESARAGAEAAREDGALARLDLWYRVSSRYLTAIAAAEAMAVAESTREMARRAAAQAQGMYKLGARPRIDLVQTEALAAAAEAGAVHAREQLAIAKSALLAAMGVREPAEFTTMRPAEEPETAEPAVEAAVEAALARRPERSRAEARTRGAEADVRQAKSDWWPMLAVGASGTANGPEFASLAPNWSAGAGLTWPLFSGLKTVHGARAAAASLAATRAEQREVDVTIRAEVEQAAAGVRLARQRLPALQASVRAAREAVTLAEARYKGGEGGQPEVLDSHRTLAHAELQRVRGELDLSMARLAFDRATARMPERLR